MTHAQAAQAGQELPLSAVIESLLDEAGGRGITIGDIIDRTEDRGFGVLMTIFGLPMLIPVLPPGSSTVVGSIFAIFAIQMLSGAQRPWVPRRLRNRVLSQHAVEVLRTRGLPILRTGERWSRPRRIWFGERLTLRVVAVVTLLMGVILLGPFPFLNTLPALSVMLLGTALVNRDALSLLAGLVLGGVSVGLLGLSAGVIVAILSRLRSWLP
ncbi:MAG: exopolysaccharide biosynthesis protein [Armatimonadetes bacterium]|nr:exopolysaccharide biosynthesis protein [Armatimonadota bacterium]